VIEMQMINVGSCGSDGMIHVTSTPEISVVRRRKATRRVKGGKRRMPPRVRKWEGWKGCNDVR
jgi:hypothetical protein